MLLCTKHGLHFNTIAEVYNAALDFAAPGEDGALFLPDVQFREEYGLDGAFTEKTLSAILVVVSGLNRETVPDALLVDAVARLRGAN
jgi:hypothetical protein